MTTSTLTSKGQITLPKEVREHLRIAEGDRLEFSIAGDGSVQLRPVSGSVRKLFGLLHREGAPAASLEEMDRAVSEVLAQDNARIRAGR
jgi:antitoxin PrlF